MWLYLWLVSHLPWVNPPQSSLSKPTLFPKRWAKARVAKREVLETKISVVPQETKCGMAFDTAVKLLNWVLTHEKKNPCLAAASSNGWRVLTFGSSAKKRGSDAPLKKTVSASAEENSELPGWSCQ
jgi:hypothetical protein